MSDFGCGLSPSDAANVAFCICSCLECNGCCPCHDDVGDHLIDWFAPGAPIATSPNIHTNLNLQIRQIYSHFRTYPACHVPTKRPVLQLFGQAPGSANQEASQNSGFWIKELGMAHQPIYPFLPTWCALSCALSLRQQKPRRQELRGARRC